MHNSDGFNVIWKESSPSTNAELKSAVSDMPDGTVLATVSQNEGYGQGDHKWHSAPGMNLTFSILRKYSQNRVFPATEQQLLTMATSLAVLDFLCMHSVEASIKMPNDIYVSGNKICGIMIENGLYGKNMKWSVIGIGLNINETEFPKDLPNPVSLSMLTGVKYEIKKCLSEFLKHFSIRFDAIWTEPETLRKDYGKALISLQR